MVYEFVQLSDYIKSEYEQEILTFSEAQSQLLGAFRLVVKLETNPRVRELLRVAYEETQAELVDLLRGR